MHLPVCHPVHESTKWRLPVLLKVLKRFCIPAEGSDLVHSPLRCLVDSQLQDSKSQFLPRIQDEKLHLVIDAFRFHNEDSGQVRLDLVRRVTAHGISLTAVLSCSFISHVIWMLYQQMTRRHHTRPALLLMEGKWFVLNVKHSNSKWLRSSSLPDGGQLTVMTTCVPTVKAKLQPATASPTHKQSLALEVLGVQLTLTSSRVMVWQPAQASLRRKTGLWWQPQKEIRNMLAVRLFNTLCLSSVGTGGKRGSSDGAANHEKWASTCRRPSSCPQ